MRPVVPSVQPPLDVLLVFCVLAERAGFGGQEGHVVAKGVQRATVTRGGSLAQLLRYLCNGYKRRGFNK